MGLDDRIVEDLRELGISGYEAKTYLALVREGRPMNGYAVAKRSGVPRSTVYETLSKLVARGAAFEVQDGDDATSYLPLPPRSLLARLERGFAASLERLEDAFDALPVGSVSLLLHRIEGQALVVARARDVIEAASDELYLSAWPDEVAVLGEALVRAHRRGVDLTSIVFGEDVPTVGVSFVHRFSDPETVRERVGCRLLAVVADRREVVIAGAVGDDVWGLYSDDPAIVLIAVEYVRHDIAMQVLVERFGTESVEKFWHDDPILERLATGRGAPGLDDNGRVRRA